MFKLPPYTELKADGIYRYRRRVPADDGHRRHTNTICETPYKNDY